MLLLCSLRRLCPLTRVSVLQDKCCQYWPTEETATYGDYTVELKGDTLCDTFSLRDLVLTFVPVREKQTTARITVRITCVFGGISSLD